MKCKECNKAELESHRGYISCPNCGFIADEPFYDSG